MGLTPIVLPPQTGEASSGNKCNTLETREDNYQMSLLKAATSQCIKKGGLPLASSLSESQLATSSLTAPQQGLSLYFFIFIDLIVAKRFINWTTKLCCCAY